MCWISAACGSFIVLKIYFIYNDHYEAKASISTPEGQPAVQVRAVCFEVESKQAFVGLEDGPPDRPEYCQILSVPLLQYVLLFFLSTCVFAFVPFSLPTTFSKVLVNFASGRRRKAALRSGARFRPRGRLPDLEGRRDRDQADPGRPRPPVWGKKGCLAFAKR